MGVSMGVLFPMLCLSNIFVDPETMPSGLEAFINISPITYLVASVRSLMDGSPDGTAIAWTYAAATVLMVVFGALTLRAYNRR
jgi:ABC-2 type transport system permease protein